MKNQYRVIVIREGEEGIRQFSMGKLTLFSVFLFVIATVTSITLLFTDYYTRQEYQNKLAQLQTDNEKLIEKINNQDEKINRFVERLDTIISQDKVLRDLIKLPQIHDDIRKVGVGGGVSYDESGLEYLLPPESVDKVDLGKFNRKLDFYNRLANLEFMSYNEIVSVVRQSPEKYRAYPAIRPVDMKKAKLTSGFGYRPDPFQRRNKFHEGHDFSARTGTPVYATADGVVVKSKYYGTFGNYIEIDHGYGYTTAYAHLSKRKVRKGERVERGQYIGAVGNTGRSTAPHLHYEVKYYDKSTDPGTFYFDDYIN